MCEEMRDAWRRVKDDAGGARGRAAGRRRPGVLRRPRHQKPYGQPDDIWNHEDPGELLSPKWQKVWKPVVCAVQGICTAGAFYFVNESDIVICSPDATFFDSHVTYGMVSALEPVGLMRKVGLAETLRMALTRQRRAGRPPTPRCASAWSPRSSLGTRLWDRAHEIAAGIAAQADRGDPGHGPGDLGVARPALPRRDGAGPHLHAARQPDRHGRGRGQPAAPARAEVCDERAAAPAALSRADRGGARARPRRARDRVRAAAGTRGASSRRPSTPSPSSSSAGHAGRHPAAQPAGARRPASLGVLARRRLRRHRQPRCAASSAPAPISPASASAAVAGEPRRPRDAGRALRDDRSQSTELGTTPVVTGRGADRGRRHRAPPGVAVEMLTERHHRPPEAGRPDLRDARRGCCAGAKHYERDPRSRAAAALGRGDRQRAARPPRRPVPRPAVRQRRSLVLPARAVHRRRAGSTPSGATGRRPSAWCPPALRMVLDADLDPADLCAASARSCRAPRRSTPTTPTRSTAKYGIPVLITYAATEFGGGVAGWNLARPRAVLGGQARQRRPGPRRVRAAGRRPRRPGARPPTQEGLLEVKAAPARRRTGGWIRTTDLARIDADGFLWILGRADQAIIRGGFKVLPDDVRVALERDPRVRGAAVDRRGRPPARRGAGRRGRAARRSERP